MINNQYCNFISFLNIILYTVLLTNEVGNEVMNNDIF